MQRIRRLFRYLVAWWIIVSLAVLAAPVQQGNIIVGIDPPILAVQPDQEFSVSVYVDSGQQPIDGAQVTLAFDPAHLIVIELVPGASLSDVFPPPSILPDGYDNSEGRISFAAGKLFGDLPSGNLQLLSMRFKAVSETAGTLIQFVDDARLPASKVTHSGEDLGTNLQHGVVTIGSLQANTLTPTTEPTETDLPTDTPLPTETPVPTETPWPTDTPIDTPEPTSSSGNAYPGPQVTATWTPPATDTPVLPTATLSPTASSSEPAPTASPTSRRDAPPTVTQAAPMATATLTPVVTVSATSTLSPTLAGANEAPAATDTPVTAPSATATMAQEGSIDDPNASSSEGMGLQQPDPTPAMAVEQKEGNDELVAIISILIIAVVVIGFAFGRRRWLSG